MNKEKKNTFQAILWSADVPHANLPLDNDHAASMTNGINFMEASQGSAWLKGVEHNSPWQDTSGTNKQRCTTLAFGGSPPEHQIKQETLVYWGAVTDEVVPSDENEQFKLTNMRCWLWPNLTCGKTLFEVLWFLETSCGSLKCSLGLKPKKEPKL